MSTYTVTDSVSQPVSGGGSSTVSLVNNGPSTIYLDDTTSVGALNGMVLPPTGQMTWNARTPLFCVCPPGGTAQLVINDAAGPVDTARARFWQTLKDEPARPVGNLYSFPDFLTGLNGPVVECGHVNTLLLIIKVNDTVNNSNPPGSFRINLSWFDNNQQFLSFDQMSVYDLFPASNPGGAIYVRIPVVGSFVSMRLNETGGNNGAVQATRFTLYGTDRVFPYAYWCSNDDGSAGKIVALGSGGVGALSGSDNVSLQHGGTNGFGNIFVAGVGQRIGLTYLPTGLTNAGARRYREGPDATNVFFETNFLTTQTQGFYLEFILPAKRLIVVQNVGGLAGTTLSWSHTWLDSIPS